MAHYAFIDENNVIVEVIVGIDEGVDGLDWESHYGKFRGLQCKKTSYNTFANAHPEGRPFRKNYAGIGYTYDAARDAFIPPKPYPSWTLIESTCTWQAPVPMPTDNKPYRWDEPTLSWIEITL